MRQKIVAGNWKMNKNLQEGIELAKEIDKLVSGLTANDVKVILAPSFVSAQNCAAEASGAYTGEVSASMIKSTGAEYTIIGHSERRAYYGETDAILLKKVKLALANGLKPIFCIGEVLEERESGKHFDVVKKQIENGLFELTADEFKNVVLAYEPVWAIGTGKTATSAQAQEIHKFIRETVASKYGKAVADNTSILYGGSCKASNAKELFANPDVDGGLIGGAALVATEFLGIITGF
jgi:triosephosphate isomerase